MPTYSAPVRDLQFVLHDLLGIAGSAVPGYDEMDRETTGAILEEAGKLAEQVLQPLNAIGDAQGCRLENGVVRTPEGFREAYDALRTGGWLSLDADPEYGGQGMPYVLETAAGEIFASANISMAIYKGLTHGAVSALRAHGSEEQKATYLPKMIEGAWSGTMNLTEPQCGTDLGLIQIGRASCRERV